MTSNKSKDKVFIQKINTETLQYNYYLEGKWKKFKQEYELLHTCLEDFLKELSTPILMSLRSKVFVRAQLCNTNKVFIRYNEVFTKQIAHEAKVVCKINIKRCDGMIENLTKENQLLSDNFCVRQEIIADSKQLQEIIEPYDESEFEAWKKIHKQKEKGLKQLKNKDIKNEDCEKVSIENKMEGINKIIDPPRNKYLANCHSYEILIMHGAENEDGHDSSSLTNENYDDEDLDDDDEDLNDDDGVLDNVDIDDNNDDDDDDDNDDDDNDDDDNDDDDNDDDDNDNDDDDDDDNDDDDDDIDDDEDEDSKLEIVFTNDVPETIIKLKNKIKKKVSFNNHILIKEFESMPEEHFIRRREETIQEIEKPEILVMEIDDIVGKAYDTFLED